MHDRPALAKTLARALGEAASHKIWRSVVFAGAMLGTAACGGSSKGAQEPAPTPVVNEAAPADPAPGPAADEMIGTDPVEPANPCAATADPCAMAADPTADPTETGQAVDPLAAANPCAADGDKPAVTTGKHKRPRGHKSRPTGRGFILS